MSAGPKQLFEAGALRFLGVTKLLGCGHEGCVYGTDHDTVVKVTNGRLHNGENAGDMEVQTVRQLMRLRGLHRIVPDIFRVGRIDTLLDNGRWAYFVEREGLNDLQLSEEGEAQFTGGPLAELLGGVGGAKTVFGFPSYVPAEDRRVLSQIVVGYNWLKARGFDLDDHNVSDNWGVRADGSVALRDFGHIWVHTEVLEKYLARES